MPDLPLSILFTLGALGFLYIAYQGTKSNF